MPEDDLKIPRLSVPDLFNFVKICIKIIQSKQQKNIDSTSAVVTSNFIAAGPIKVVCSACGGGCRLNSSSSLYRSVSPPLTNTQTHMCGRSQRNRKQEEYLVAAGDAGVSVMDTAAVSAALARMVERRPLVLLSTHVVLARCRRC